MAGAEEEDENPESHRFAHETDEEVQYAWKVSLLLFGPLAEQFGQRRIDFAVLEGSRAIDAIERFQLGERLTEGLSVAIDGKVGPADRMLHDGAEIALLPPVSGG